MILSIILLGEICALVVYNNEDVENNKGLNDVEDEEIKDIDSNLNDIIKELNNNNISFSEIRKEENGYNIKVIVEGNAEIFREKLKYINKYLISDYELKIKNDNIKVIATLNY